MTQCSVAAIALSAALIEFASRVRRHSGAVAAIASAQRGGGATERCVTLAGRTPQSAQQRLVRSVQPEDKRCHIVELRHRPLVRQHCADDGFAERLRRQV
jgi:hypothetical protein